MYDRTDLGSLVRHKVVVGFGPREVSHRHPRWDYDLRDSTIHDILLGLDYLG
jgi:hypothetical protein